MNGHPDWPGIRLVDEQRCTEAACMAGGVYYSHALVTRLWPAMAPTDVCAARRLQALTDMQAAIRGFDTPALHDAAARAAEWRRT